MAWESFEIEQYEVYAVAHNTPGYSDIHALIRLYWQGRQQATLLFYQDSVTTIPASASYNSGGFTNYYGRFRQAAFRDGVDLLRNEKPVFFLWNETTKGAFLATGQEPIGEGELP